MAVAPDLVPELPGLSVAESFPDATGGLLPVLGVVPLMRWQRASKACCRKIREFAPGVCSR